MQIKNPHINISGYLFISDKLYIDRKTENNKVIAIDDIKIGEVLIKEYPKINLFGEKVEDRDVSFIKKLILSEENELFPRDFKQFKRTRMSKKIFDKINSSDKKFFQRYDNSTIEFYYEKHLFNSFEGYDYGPLYLPTIAKVNHSCNPNTKFIFDKNNGIMSLISIKNIKKNTEITDSYLSNKTIKFHSEYLLDHYGFSCECC
jgi:hypothetical protein